MQGPKASTTITPPADDSSDFTSFLTSCTRPIFKSLASAAVASLAPPVVATPTSVPTPRGADRFSSPPPVVEDELAVCMSAFAAARRLSDDILDKAIEGLDDVCYTPDIMGEVTADRLQSLTNLPEGHAIALRKFAREWCSKIDAKRARRS